jgi:hypothetical protein
MSESAPNGHIHTLYLGFPSFVQMPMRSLGLA